ncbi:MAG TPA: glycosyl hydrolase family 2 [Terriglobales bacterium]|nr:glycosyl hydrolase family 2 [Terriglobales bacterium]
MTQFLASFVLVISICSGRLLSFASTGDRSKDGKLPLAQGWMIQSSAKTKESGEVLSTTRYRPKGWYPAAVPTTIIAALVKNNVYPDPYFGKNLRSIPGTTYPIGKNFSNLPMPANSPFAVPWWYRTEFQAPAEFNGKQIWLNFQGINYRANIFLNGQQIATDQNVAGAWRIYEFNVTNAIHTGEGNVLAVEVFPPGPNDLAVTFVDWNPLPADKDMGLWRGVSLSSSGPVTVRHAHVVTKVDPPTLENAHLTVTADVRNAGDQPVKAEVKGKIENLEFSQPVELGPGESKEVEFTPEKFSQLNASHPRLWWPAQMGEQNLYDLHIETDVDGKASDQQDVSFGIREVTSELNAEGYLQFRINGKPILIRGGGWSPDMMLRENPRWLEDHFRYTRDMGLNTIRLEGKLETDQFFDLADRYGILLMAGWCCCDAWEKWTKWPEANFKISADSLRDQIQRLQNHPSFFVWLNGSDNPPPPDVEQNYIGVLKQCRWPNPYVSSATEKPTPITGKSGVKMTGPYEYVAPGYWLEDKTHGGAYGFNTETSPGPAIPVVESLERFIPKERLWPINDYWNYHAGGGAFKDVSVFTNSLNRRYGKATDLQDYNQKSQLMAYEGIRAMFEAFSREKYRSTGVIQWMLNNAWPSVIWHLYDYYMQPAGGYFGAKKACEPLHAQYSYDDHSVALVSSQYTDAKGLKVTAKVLNLDLTEKFSKEVTVHAAADSSTKLFDIPVVEGLSPTYFLRLSVADPDGKVLSTNLYWLSTKPETLDWKKSTWYYTPTASFADFTALKNLAPVKLKVSSHRRVDGKRGESSISVENPSKALAFFIRVKVAKGVGGREVLPILYQDNYFSLLPGERRDISASYRMADLGAKKPVVEVSGWNVKQ